MSVSSLPSPGAIAKVRQRTYLVEEVLEGNSVSDSTLVRLSCVDDDNQGVPLEVLWENELDTEVMTGEAWQSVAKKGFDKTVASSQLQVVGDKELTTDNRQLTTALLPIDADDDRASLSEEELQADDDSQIERLSLLANGPIQDAARSDLVKQEIKLLDEMTEVAESARHSPDARIRQLLHWMKENMCPDLGASGAQWNDTRIITK